MKVSGFFKALNMSASGLRFQRQKLDAISENIANANTTRTEEGGPYQRKVVIAKLKNKRSFASVLKNNQMNLETRNARHINPAGQPTAEMRKAPEVENTVVRDQAPFRKIYDPSHPDADSEGYVLLPNVNPLNEMIDLIAASRGYEANITVIESFKSMAKDALDI